MLFEYKPNGEPVFLEEFWNLKRYELGRVLSGVAVFAVHELVDHQKPREDTLAFDDDDEDEDTPDIAQVVSREYHLCNVLPGHTWLVEQCKDLPTCLSKIEAAVDDLSSRTAALQLAFSSARHQKVEGSPHPQAEHIHQWADGANMQHRLVPNPMNSDEFDKDNPPSPSPWITMKNFIHEYRVEPSQEQK